MTKLQLLYEKLMRISYIFGAAFFLSAVIDFSAAMMTGAFSCTTGVCRVGDQYPFYQWSLWFTTIATIVFIIAGFVFYTLAHRESDLLSVSDYKRSLEQEQAKTQYISRDELYEKLRRGNRKQKVEKEPFFKRIQDAITKFIDDFKESREQHRLAKKEAARMTKEQVQEVQRIEEERVESEKLERARTKLNKTGLILLLSKNTELTQNNARLFINSFLEVIKDQVIAGEEVKIAKFGRFSKVLIKEHTEIDEETGKETHVEEHNTVDFQAFKHFLEKLNEHIESDLLEHVEEDHIEAVEADVVEPVEVVKVIEETKQPKDEPVTQEPVVEEVIEEEPKETVMPEVEESQEESTVEETKEEPTKETKDTIEEEPIVEEAKQEEPPVVEETKEEPVQDEKVEEPVQLEVTPVVKEEPKVEEKPKKPAKPKVVTKTKKEFIEMMDNTTDLSKNKANKFLKFFAEVVKEQLALREDVELPGIGFFTTIEMPAKEAVNPQTNEKIIVPAHHQVRLRFDEDLKDKMNQ